MNKKLIIGALIIFLLGIGGWFYFSKYQLSISVSDNTINEPKPNLPEKKLPPPVHIISDRAEKFSVSSGDGYPVFSRELISDPFKVKEGEDQYFSIWAKDPEGVEKVTATIKTDKGDEIIEMQLAEGTETDGRWQCSWLTKNISLSDSYSTEFVIVNKNGKGRESTFSWYLLK